MKRRTIAVGETGNVLGEAHHNAKLTDADVELIRDIYDEGMASYKTLAGVFGVSKETIRDIVTFRRRATTPAAYRPATEVEAKRPLPKSKLDELGVGYEAEERDDDWDSNH